MKNLLTSIALILSAGFFAQTIPSNCNASDSVKKLYKKDAERLTVRRVYEINDPYKDSIRLKKPIVQRYMDALLAVKNATALPDHALVFDNLNLHTDLNPPLNAVLVKANPNQQWMLELFANTSPTSNAVINGLINTYDLQFTYSQSALYDVVVFSTDSNLNMTPMAQLMASQPGVIAANAEGAFNDEKNITDSVNTNFVMLTYSYGWGTCNDTCDFRRNWTFKVFNDCSVEYIGVTGPPLDVSIAEQSLFRDVRIYPMPVSDELHIQMLSNSENKTVRLFNLLGEELINDNFEGTDINVDLKNLSQGIYILKINSEKGMISIRIIKD